MTRLQHFHYRNSVVTEKRMAKKRSGGRCHAKKKVVTKKNGALTAREGELVESEEGLVEELRHETDIAEENLVVEDIQELVTLDWGEFLDDLAEKNENDDEERNSTEEEQELVTKNYSYFVKCLKEMRRREGSEEDNSHLYQELNKDLSKSEVKKILSLAGMKKKDQPETLTDEEFIKIAKEISPDHESKRWMFTGVIGRRHRRYFRDMAYPREEPWVVEDIFLQNKAKWKLDEEKLTLLQRVDRLKANRMFFKGKFTEEIPEETPEVIEPTEILPLEVHEPEKRVTVKLDHSRIVRALKTHHPHVKILTWNQLFTPRHMYALLAFYKEGNGSEISSPEEYGVPSTEGPALEVYINSPIATMARMAVIQFAAKESSGDLVDLIIEPVDERKKFGEMYLGVVQDLAPRMKGAFVDIGNPPIHGISHGSLLELRINRFGFTIPFSGRNVLPFRVPRPKKQKEVVKLKEEFQVESDIEMDEVLEENGEDSEEESDKETEEFFDVVEEDIEEELPESKDIENVEEYFEVSEEPKKGHMGGRPTFLGRKALQLGTVPMSSLPGYQEDLSQWGHLKSGMLVLVQVSKERIGTKEARLSPFPFLYGRYVTIRPGVTAFIAPEQYTHQQKLQLRQKVRRLLPENFGCIFHDEAIQATAEQLERDIRRMLYRWQKITEDAVQVAEKVKSGDSNAAPVLLSPAMGGILTALKDIDHSRVSKIVIDDPKRYEEVLHFLEDFAPELTSAVHLHKGKEPIFDTFHDIESQIQGITSKRIDLPSGANLIMEKTEAMWVVDVNGGKTVLTSEKDGFGKKKFEGPNLYKDEASLLRVNLEAVTRVAKEIQLRDIGGIIAMDLITMSTPESNQKVMMEMRKAVSRDRALVQVFDVNPLGVLMLTRGRTSQSLLQILMDSCDKCGFGSGQEAIEYTFLKLELALTRLRLTMGSTEEKFLSDSWHSISLRVSMEFQNFLTGPAALRFKTICQELKLNISLSSEEHFNRSQFLISEVSELEALQVAQSKEETKLERLPNAPREEKTKLSALKQIKIKVLKRKQANELSSQAVAKEFSDLSGSDSDTNESTLPVLQLEDLVGGMGSVEEKPQGDSGWSSNNRQTDSIVTKRSPQEYF